MKNFFCNVRPDSRIIQMDIYTALRAVADLAMPRSCVVCGRRLSMHEKHICIPCLADLPLTHFWSLPRNPMGDSFNAQIEDTRYCYAAALFRYDGSEGYNLITQALKYHRNFGAGRYFAGMLAEYLAAALQFEDVDVVVPVPLHWRRKLKRGYNQAEIIAEAVAEKMSASKACLLRRKRNTKSQAHMTSDAKRANVADAFEADKTAAARLARQLGGTTPKHILIIDDVYTTGSTLAACHKALRQIYNTDVRISAVTLAWAGT